jgi:ectoine hydroxylase-related dioxygenase (phytanoyl-CoA dioxygenase family)
MSSLISDAQKQQYREEGYFILERVIPAEHLEILRRECGRFIDLINADMDRAGVRVQGLNHRDSRYFIAKRFRESDLLPRFLFSDLMAAICRATLGGEAYLFWEQYVVKCAEVGMEFNWHQDSGYVGHDHRPYVSCWCALDDMTEANGTVYILPYSRAGTRDRGEHVRQEGSNDLVGYHGDDPGVPVIVPAGSIAVFSSVTFHRSGANRTGAVRRVYLPQYSAEPILKRDGSGLWGLAEPFLESGERVPSPLLP